MRGRRWRRSLPPPLPVSYAVQAAETRGGAMHAAQLSQEGGAEHDTASCACSLGVQHAKPAGRPLRTPCLLLIVASLPSQAQLMPKRLGLGSPSTAR